MGPLGWVCPSGAPTAPEDTSCREAPFRGKGDTDGHPSRGDVGWREGLGLDRSELQPWKSLLSTQTFL